MEVFLILSVVFSFVACAPSLRVMPEHLPLPQLLTLPSNATSIRTDISDGFSCDGRDYGYYADVDNDCQLFHVCLPMTYSDGHSQTFRWSFICPEETVFNQEIFTCTRSDEAIECAESPRFYSLNQNFGMHEEAEAATAMPAMPSASYNQQSSETSEPNAYGVDDTISVPGEVPQSIGRAFTPKSKKIIGSKKH